MAALSLLLGLKKTGCLVLRKPRKTSQNFLKAYQWELGRLLLGHGDKNKEKPLKHRGKFYGTDEFIVGKKEHPPVYRRASTKGAVGANFAGRLAFPQRAQHKALVICCGVK